MADRKCAAHVQLSCDCASENGGAGDDESASGASNSTAALVVDTSADNGNSRILLHGALIAGKTAEDVAEQLDALEARIYDQELKYNLT